MKFNHVGIPVTGSFDGEIDLPHLKMTVSNHENNPYGIQWQRYWDDAPYPELVKTVPHVAFVVKNIAEEISGRKVIIKPNSPSEGLVVAFIEISGVPVALMEYQNTTQHSKSTDQPIKEQIEACEERLKLAMLQSDVATLSELLAPNLIFTNHLGQLMTKQDDLNAHQTGMLKINAITLSGQQINIHANVAIVSVQAHISGSFAGKISENDFRFTRTWNKSSSNVWQIIGGHSSIVT